MLLAVLCSTQSHAQSFLKNLGESIKQEVKQKVEKGVNDTLWAPVNSGYHPPTTPKEALKYSDRFYAKSDQAPFNWCENDMKLWCNFTDDGKMYKNEANDPCPEGWRLPDIKDFYKLIEHSSDLVTNPETGQVGRWFSGPLPYSILVPRIFLPAAGLRYSDGSSAFRGTHGAYWSLRHGGGELMVYYLTFSSDDIEIDPFGAPHDAYSVRCVKDLPGQLIN